MHSDNTPIVQIRRSNKEFDKVKTEPLTFGEEFLTTIDHKVAVAESGTDESPATLEGSRVVKLVTRDNADYSVYYSNSSTDGLRLYDDDRQTELIPRTDHMTRQDSTNLETSLRGIESDISSLEADVALKAYINSPTLTGIPQAPVPSADIDESSKQIATAGWTIAKIAANREKKQIATTDASIYLTGIQDTESGQEFYCDFSKSAYIKPSTGRLYGAAWNDYAEFEPAADNYMPGTVVCYDKDGILKESEQFAQVNACVVSDTFGMVLGGDEGDKVPVAVCGRVPVKTIGNIAFGDTVCAATGGFAIAMTRDQIREYPDRILGTVCNATLTDDGRVWIKLR